MYKKSAFLISLILLLSFAVHSAFGELVAYYPMDEGSGTLVKDFSGNGHDGEAQAEPDWIDSVPIFGKAINFDGTNPTPHWINCGTWNPSAETGQLSVSCWVNWGGYVSGSWQGVISKRDGWSSGGMMWYIEINGTNGYLLFGRMDYYGLGIMDALTPDVWQHITATCDGETGNWYIDGELMDSNPLTLGPKEDATLTIGSAELGGANAFFGAIDEVRLYDTALTQEEIQTVMYDIGVDIELALKPRPRDEATEVKRDVILSWIPGLYAHNHNVYFGTDFNDVNEATPDDPRGVLLSENQDGTTFDPFGNDLLEYGGTYYWRIDEINDLEPNSPWIGETWSFTTGNFIVVDDFEDYNDFPPDEIWNTWIDGYDVPTNGSSTGYPNPDFIAGEHYMEDTVVRSGLWSMPVFYDNSTARLSEVTRTFDSSMGNWTVDDVVTLTLFYYGDSNNTTEPMYVAVDSALVTNDDANAALITEWTRWDIPLQELVDQGVNLNSVGSMTIGFGNKANPTAGGGAGHVFFDDIRLYRP